MPPRPPKRTSRLQSSTAHKTERRSDSAGIDIPLNWLKSGVGVLLLPCCIVATQSFLSAFGETSAKTLLIQSAELWFFFIGVLLWLIYFFGLPRPLFLYVLGHELTHAFFVLLCGGKISEFKVKSGGGHIVTNKNKVLISLSPYFIPFYSVILIALFGIIGIFVDNLFEYHPNALFWGKIGFSWSWILYMSVGITWCFHLTFTSWMITKNQPDLKQNGTFFSLVFIYFINLMILSITLILVSNEISLTGFVESLLNNGSKLINQASRILR